MTQETGVPAGEAAFPAEKTAIVTGAVSPRGIGRTTVDYLAERGWNIGIIDLDDDGCKAVASEVAAKFNVKAAGVGADVADETAVRAAVDKLEEQLPQIVALVNLAGVSSPIPYLELEPAEWNRVLNINLNGVHYMTRRVSESLVKNRIGRIVNISSVSAQRGGGTFSKTPYSVAKAGVIGLTRSVARELGGYDVTVNAVSPGPIDTDIMGGTLTEERKQAMAAEGVLNRVGRPRDIAAAIHFLIGEDAGFITGQTLNVDGGLYMH
ncbi:SDR family NAD(P)-dependent oxidoreductase [Arthrobacter monumenti]